MQTYNQGRLLNTSATISKLKHISGIVFASMIKYNLKCTCIYAADVKKIYISGDKDNFKCKMYLNICSCCADALSRA